MSFQKKLDVFEQAKKNAAVFAANLVENGMTIGLGSGTTVFWLIRELAERVKQGLQLTVVPTSRETAHLAKTAGITLADLNEVEQLPVTIDGADEIDPKGQLIKGGGGALLQEKMVAAASAKLIIIADSSKLVQQLGKFALPVEVIPAGYVQVEQKILKAGICKHVTLRKKDRNIFTTDHQHYILDCDCERVPDPSSLNILLHLVPGVVETGLFVDMASQAVIGHEDGRVEVITYR
jgi:ribose 5-phosphate isomerase A